MSIIERTTNLDLTQYSGSPVKAQLYANYNEDMQKIDAGYHTLDDSINGTGGLGDRISALETDLPLVDAKADDAIATANDAKATADGMDTRVTAAEGDIVDLKAWKDNTVDPTLSAYDSRLDAIELVIDTVSTANINDLIARMDALEIKVDANAQAIDTLNDNLINAVNRITDLETGLGTTNANLNALTNRVSVLEDCCSSVRTTLSDHNTRITKNASDISALDARLTRDETNIAGNASDITILATQNNTQAEQIDDLYNKYNALDPTSPTNLYSRVQTLEDTVGNEPLQTVAQTVTGAINELFGHATDVDADEVDYDNSNSGLVATDVQGAIDEVVGAVGTEDARIEALETTVGGAGSGLVKDVADNASAIGTLETTVGDNNNGLVKDVADLQTTVGDRSAGLVKDVTDLQTTVGDSGAGLVKDVTDLGTTVGDNTAGLVKDVADLQTTVGDATAGLVKDVADVQEVIPSGASVSNKLATSDDVNDYRWKSVDAPITESTYSTYGALLAALFAQLNTVTNFDDYEFRIFIKIPSYGGRQIYTCADYSVDANNSYMKFSRSVPANATSTSFTEMCIGASVNYITSCHIKLVNNVAEVDFTDQTNASISSSSTATWDLQYRKI